MRELVLFRLEDTRYGIWRDQILSVEDVQSLHRLPFARSSLTVLSVFGGLTRTLADLPLCLGHPATSDARGASAWLLSERESIRGFLVSAERVSLQVSPEALVRAPEFLRSLPLEGFFSHDALPVPVIDVSALLERVRRAEREKPAPPLALDALSIRQQHPADRFRVFASSGSLFAAHGDDLAETAISERQMARMPLLPPNIAGVALSHDNIIPVVDLALRLSGNNSRESSRILEADLGGTALGFLVDEDGGEWAGEDVTVKDLPPVLRAPWMRSAVVRGAQIAPLIELGNVLAGPARGEGGHPQPRHVLDSRFSSLFGRQSVEVVEFSALGTIFAVPQNEVRDVLPCQPFQESVLAAGLVAGLADFGGDLVPVLDLDRIGAEPPQRTSDWRMIVLENDDFRALIMCESVRDARSLGLEVQRDVPVVLPFPVVYGCYTDREAVRLVLNIEELTVHYHQSGAALLLPALASAMGESPTRARVTRAAPEPARPAPAPPSHIIVEPVSPAPHMQEWEGPDQSGSQPVSESSLPAEIVLGPTQPGPATSGPAVPAAEQLHDVEPEHEVPHAAEPEPSLPGLAVEQHVTAEPAPSIGDEDILEPVYVTPASAPAAPPSAMGEAPIDSAAQHAPAQSPAASPARARTVRRVLFAAGAAILIAACVVLGLHLGIFRSKPAVPAAPAAPAAAQQEMTAEQQSPPGAETLYVVKEGDTLWDIAARFTGDAHNYRGIAAHNGITNPDLISPGQVIRLPR